MTDDEFEAALDKAGLSEAEKAKARARVDLVGLRSGEAARRGVDPRTFPIQSLTKQ